MLDTLWSLGAFIVALGLLVTVHEYGHYWVARRNGVKVRRFSVGFGKIIYSRYDKHGTEFAIAAIPLGGYVKMLDERTEEVPEELKDQSFNSKTVLQRMAIIFAGPAANFIFAVFVLWLMYMVGQTEPKPIIGAVQENSIVAEAGVTGGVEIVAINGKQTRDWNAVNLAFVPNIGGESIAVETVNVETRRKKTYLLDIKDKDLDKQNQSIIRTLGIMPYSPKVSTEIADVTSGSAAERDGLKVGDKIVKINEFEQPSWPEMVKLIMDNGGTPLNMVIVRDGTRQDITVTPQVKEHNGKPVGFIGVRPVFEGWKEDELVHIQYGPFDAFVEGIKETASLTKLTFVMLGKFFTADVSVKSLSGPISIAQGAGQSADAGFAKFLWFLALLSVNLGVINLLPLPILDGGHLFYYTIELIRGKSVSERAQNIGFMFGAAVLFLLMGIAMLNDISRLS